MAYPGGAELTDMSATEVNRFSGSPVTGYGEATLSSGGIAPDASNGGAVVPGAGPARIACDSMAIRAHTDALLLTRMATGANDRGIADAWHMLFQVARCRHHVAGMQDIAPLESYATFQAGEFVSINLEHLPAAAWDGRCRVEAVIADAEQPAVHVLLAIFTKHKPRFAVGLLVGAVFHQVQHQGLAEVSDGDVAGTKNIFRASRFRQRFTALILSIHRVYPLFCGMAAGVTWSQSDSPMRGVPVRSPGWHLRT